MWFDRAIRIPEVEGESSGEQDRAEADHGKDVGLAVLEEEPDAIDDREGQADNHRLARSDVPGADSLPELFQDRGVLAEVAECQDRNDDVDEDICQRIFLRWLGINFRHRGIRSAGLQPAGLEGSDLEGSGS